MKYETPELTALSAASLIQNSVGSKNFPVGHDAMVNHKLNEPGNHYADWE